MGLPHLTLAGYLTALAWVVPGIAGQWLAGLSPWAWLVPALVWAGAIASEGLRCRRYPPQLIPRLPGRLYLGRAEPVGFDLLGRAPWRQRVEAAWPPAAALAVLDPGRRLLRLPPQGTATLRWRFRALALGAVSPADVYLRLSGPWGLSRWTLRLPVEGRFTVVPDVLHAGTTARGQGRPGERPWVRPGGGSELHALRAYQPGDPLRAVDWKATARRGEPMVRLFDEQQALELLVLLDVGRASGVSVGGLSRLHHGVNLASRLAEAAGRAGDRAGGLCFAAGVTAQAPLAGGPAGIRQLRLMLQRQRPLEQESNPLVAALRARQLLRHRGLVVFLTDLTDAEAAEQTRQAVALLGRKHLPLVGAVADMEARRLVTEPGEGWLAPYRSLAGQELLNAQALLAERLRRLGAHVVVDSPQRLDAALLQRFEWLRRRRAV